MKVLALALTLLLTSQAFAVSRNSSKNIGEKKETNSKNTNGAVRASLEALQTKFQEVGLKVEMDINKITKDMTATEANQVKNQAKEVETALESKKGELANNSKSRGEVEVVLQMAFDALTTRSQYVKAKEGANKQELENLNDTIGVLDNALTIVKAKALDAENVSKSDMVTIFQTIASIRGTKAADVVAQAGRVVDAIKKMGKTPFEVISCR